MASYNSEAVRLGIIMEQIQIKPTCFYHPISALFVDDNKSFLATLELEFAKYSGVLTCTDPHKALELIKQSEEDISQLIIHQVDDMELDETSGHLVDIRLDQIAKIIYNANRGKFIAVAVIDYDMPEMNGIELASALSRSQICKIILTVKADEKLAVQAFNDGIIDQFLIKANNDEMNSGILSAIAKLKQRYFDRLSTGIMDSLGKSFKDLIASSNFQMLFDRAYHQAGAIEYYLVDKEGSYLFLDQEANPTWLIVQSNKAIETTIAMLEASDSPSSVVNALRQREKILFLPANDDYKQLDTLENNLFEANRLGDDHFYSIVKGKITRFIDWDKVKPCHFA